MKCQATSNTTHSVLISKEISYKSFKEVCGMEKKKVNLGFNLISGAFEIANNSLVPIPKILENFIYGKKTCMSHDWEILSRFFSIHNIEPNWLNCQYSWGSYSADLGGWTGCTGKV